MDNIPVECALLVLSGEAPRYLMKASSLAQSKFQVALHFIPFVINKTYLEPGEEQDWDG